MVRDALNTRTVLDGPAFAAILGELPPGSSTFRKVRLEQGEALVEQMQAMSRSIAATQARAAARQYERQAAEGYEQAAIFGMQEAIALAAVALERAKAAWQTSEAIRKGRRA
jgi:secreted protein with Ig-like and vWFA domain